MASSPELKEGTRPGGGQFRRARSSRTRPVAIYSPKISA